MKRVATLSLLLSLFGCRSSEVIDPTQFGFRVDTVEIDFGRVLEGSVAVSEITVVGTGRSDVEVVLQTNFPFSVPTVVTVKGAALTKVPVEFRAGNGPVSAEVRLSAISGSARVKLNGIGVRPKICIPQAACKVSTYSFELDACVESQAVEASPCQPDSVCLENGECRAGQCQGSARSCDDQNVCTVDSCAMDLGCVHSPRNCPAPTALCRVATCDPSTGCAEAMAAEFTVCGSVNCISAHLCILGACQTLSTPEGFPCGPATPCQAESTCQSGQCVAPTPRVMVPKIAVPLSGTPVDERPSILSQNGNVYFQLCAMPPLPDGGSDGGDDGGTDAGLGDGGTCGLASYTGNGFERWPFAARYQDFDGRKLLQVSPRGVVLLKRGELEVRSLSTGDPTAYLLDGEVLARGVAQGADFELWAVATLDGGSWLMRWGDGGVLPALRLDAGVSLLAVDEAGAAWLYSPDAGALGFLELLSDGGGSLSWQNASAGLHSLATQRPAVVSGTRTVVGADGGSVLLPSTSDAGFALEWVERPMLASQGAGVGFYKECVSPQMSCLEETKATWVHVFSLVDGQFLWRAKVLEEGTSGRLEEVVLTGVRPGAFAALIQQGIDGGIQASLQAFAEGNRVLNCPMAEGTVLAGAVFAGNNLHALVSRDGGWALETYDLVSVPVLTTGWPQADGISGTRRAR